MFTAIHQALGVPRDAPLTYSMLEAAVTAGVVESDGLDWKRALPPEAGLGATDFPKDVAAMANSGGGVIVFGVDEAEKRATGLVDVGELTERHERALRSAAVSAVHPPVFSLSVLRLQGDGGLAVAVVVPPSVDSPHVIYRGEYFGAPVRNDADTVWMKEPALAAAYRGRFDAQRLHDETLGWLYEDAAARCVPQMAWFVGAATPRRPQAPHRDRFPEPRTLVDKAFGISEAHLRAKDHLGRPVPRGRAPLREVDANNLRPGLRRWVAVPTSTKAVHEAWASFHLDGSVTLACSLGGQRKDADENFQATHFYSENLEAAVANLMGMMRVAAGELDGEYEVRVGVEWDRREPVKMWTRDWLGYPNDGSSVPVPRYSPVVRTVDANDPAEGFVRQAVDLGLDCVNQGGITNLHHLPELT
ncbi:hypothetical protein GCM10009623_34510 [Nocardioides aestuarii]|uniref:ATP-binding protein n=1 Tax=Nocardioides aestuarii TaxID=252231 RepID=A0ABW4TSS3_9ACTN